MGWTALEVEVGGVLYRGRWRIDDQLVRLEWRGGRCVEELGYIKPELLALSRLKEEAHKFQQLTARQNAKAKAAEARRKAARVKA